MDQQGTFNYTPLPGSGWIRVLTIYPYKQSWSQDPLICDIDNNQLESKHGYVALSYSWAMPDGDSSKTHTIFIGEQAVGITRNLFEGLLRIRAGAPRYPVRLWIDAVCINQVDVEERNAQVAQMSRIYACADGVFAWLGEGGDEQAMCVLECLGKDESTKCKESHRFQVSDNGQLDLCVLRQEGTWSTDIKGRGYLDIYKIENDKNRRVYVADLAKALSVVLESRYFSRRWIVQEIYHARSVQFFWGRYQFSVATVAGCLQSLLDLWKDYGTQSPDTDRASTRARSQGIFIRGTYSELSPSKEYTSKAFATVRDVLQILEMRQDAEMEGKVVPFHEIVANTTLLDCSDERDIVFALTSLCPGCGLRPDYNMSVAEVYAAFSNRLIRHGMFQMLLENIQASHALQRPSRPSWLFHRTVGDHPPIPDLPSWALDLRRGFKIFLDRDPSPWFPPFDHPPGSPLDASFESGNILLCNVYRVGTVAKVTKDGFRLIETNLNGEYNRLEERVRVYFSNAPLARKGDVIVAFDQDETGYYCYNALLLRRSKEGGRFVVLHWAYTAMLEKDDSRAIPPRVEEKTLIRIV